MAINAPDLTKRPPRSVRVRLGGYAILPRMLDKGRATVAGTHGEYHFNCPTDQLFLDFVGVSADAVKGQLAKGKSDGQMLDWIKAHAKSKRTPAEVTAWSAWAELRAPDNPDSRTYFNEIHSKIAPKRSDVITWADLLDLDDYVSFGGKT